jgi:hypothetical protein
MRGENFGPYMGIEYKTELVYGGSSFMVFVYSAFNAYGLIGPECNGIAILQKDLGLVLDGHCKQASGYFGASKAQVDEYVRITGMKWEEFQEFCNSHPNCKMKVLERIPNLRKPSVFKHWDFVKAFDTPQEKADFANNLVRFINSGFHRKYWTKKLYQRLSNCFGHIAHFNAEGFYSTWFSSELQQREWFEHVQAWPCYGDPAYTYSDVEKAFIRYLRKKAA